MWLLLAIMWFLKFNLLHHTVLPYMVAQHAGTARVSVDLQLWLESDWKLQNCRSASSPGPVWLGKDFRFHFQLFSSVNNTELNHVHIMRILHYRVATIDILCLAFSSPLTWFIFCCNDNDILRSFRLCSKIISSMHTGWKETIFLSNWVTKGIELSAVFLVSLPL